jgi:hypothetical protein
LRPTEEGHPNYGLELHFVEPIVFGGSSTDPENRMFVPLTEHAELCRFWNNLHSRIRKSENAGETNS